VVTITNGLTPMGSLAVMKGATMTEAAVAASISTWLQVIQGAIVIAALLISIGAWKAKQNIGSTQLDDRVAKVEQAVDQKLVTREHCDLIHREAARDYARTTKTAHDANQAAQTVVTATAVITTQLKILGEQMTDQGQRLGRIEAALMKASGEE
jgi:outer membrane murein-binding lipoprotein Lpp